METINSVLFYIISAVITLSAVFVVISKKIINSIFFSLICFFLIGLIFFSLNAPFNGVIQISIYTSALSILFIIAASVTNYSQENKIQAGIKPRYLLVVAGTIMIFISVLFVIKETIKYDFVLGKYINSPAILTTYGTTKQLSAELLRHNVYQFELLGVYILLALIGISVLLVFKGGR